MLERKVILLGADSPIGLTIIRELGQAGISVHGLGWSEKSIGLYSKYLTSGHFRQKTEDELIAQINQLAAKHDCHWIMAVSESDIMLLDRNRALLRPHPIIPGSEQLKIVLDKQLTLHAADEIGINIPKTWKISDIGQLKDILKTFCYPLVLKWDNPHRIMTQLAMNNLKFDKFRYIYHETELLEYLHSFDGIDEYPLIQEFCKGIGLGQMVLMHHGEAILKFQHHRLAEWPPEGGFSTVCKSVSLESNPELMDKTVSLLKKINWSGPAMVEYRYDPISNRAVLMEINGRFWGSLPLTYYSGAYFVAAYYMMVTENTAPSLKPYVSGIKCRFIFPEIKRLARISFSSEKIQNKSLKFSPISEIFVFISDFFSLKNRYYVFDITDPKPFFMDLYQAIKKFIN